MVIFHGYVSLPEGTNLIKSDLLHRGLLSILSPGDGEKKTMPAMHIRKTPWEQNSENGYPSIPPYIPIISMMPL